MKPSHYMPKSLKFIYMTYIENAKELLLLDLRNERRLLRFYSPENRKPLKRSGSIKPRKFRTFALIPPPKNYYRSFQPIVKPNNTTLAPPTRFPQSGIPPHVQIRNKLDPLPESTECGLDDCHLFRRMHKSATFFTPLAFLASRTFYPFFSLD